jgi:hypothetical protein
MADTKEKDKKKSSKASKSHKDKDKEKGDDKSKTKDKGDDRSKSKDKKKEKEHDKDKDKDKDHHSKEHSNKSIKKSPEPDSPTNLESSPKIETTGSNCSTHSQPIKYYCDTCNEPICSECTTFGPHNNPLHRILGIDDAFNLRYTSIQNLIASSLIKKRDKLLAQMQRLGYRMEEIKSIKDIIEKDVKCELSGVLERLNSAQGMKLAVLNHDMGDLQRDISRIDSIVQQSDLSLKDDQIGFLGCYKNMHEEIEDILSKPVKTEVNVYPNDLPRELTEKRQIIDKAAHAQDVLKLKDEIIWNILQEKRVSQKSSIEALEKATKEEMAEWAKLADKFHSELIKYQLVCCYCGKQMDNKNINEDCPENTGKSQQAVTIEEAIPENHPNSGRHFFGKQKT